MHTTRSIALTALTALLLLGPAWAAPSMTELYNTPERFKGRGFILDNASIHGRIHGENGLYGIWVEADGLSVDYYLTGNINFVLDPALVKRFQRYFKPHYTYKVNLYGIVERHSSGIWVARIRKIEHLTIGGEMYHVMQ
ncbi:MAG: hypothetical protein ACLFOY_18475 [Desulfatibacillaceae bacterium]